MPFPKRRPPDAAAAQMIGLDEVLHPISFGYIVRAPWGTTRQMLTVDAAQFIGNEEATLRYGQALWRGVTAPAVTSSVELLSMSVIYWKGIGLGVPHPVLEARGEHHAFTAGRDDSPQLLLLTGHPDDDGKRRLFMPGVPRNWVAHGLLTPEGWEKLMGHARALIMGLGPGSGVSTVDWLLAYPGALEPSLTNPTGVAFRRVHHIRVCYHTDRAPEVTGLA